MNYSQYPLQPEQSIVNQGCSLNINTYTTNPFLVNPPSSTWNDNYLLLKNPNLRVLSGVAPLDRGMASSSKYNSSIHLKPCYSVYQVDYTLDGVYSPKASHPHS